MAAIEGAEITGTVSLPFLAAKGQTESNSARIGIEILGYNGPLGDILPAPSRLDVETCQEYVASFRKLQRLVPGGGWVEARPAHHAGRAQGSCYRGNGCKSQTRRRETGQDQEVAVARRSSGCPSAVRCRHLDQRRHRIRVCVIVADAPAVDGPVRLSCSVLAPIAWTPSAQGRTPRPSPWPGPGRDRR